MLFSLLLDLMRDVVTLIRLKLYLFIKISFKALSISSSFVFGLIVHTDSSTPALLHKRPLSQCMPLDSPRNGQIKNTNLFRFYLPGQRLTFECKDHYELTGEAILTCMENGNWSHPPPSCIRMYDLKSLCFDLIRSA